MTTAIASTTVATSTAFNPLTESRLSLKSIKKIRGSEGYGFECKVYFDGVFAGEAFDYADGGPVHLMPASADMDIRILAYLSAFPKMPFNGFDLDITLDIAIGELVQLDNIRKTLTRAHKKSLCLALPDTQYGSYLHIPCRPDDVDATIAAFDRKYGSGQWLMLANPRDGVVMPPEYYKADAA